MKVKELIEKLKNTEPNAEIYMVVPDYENDYNNYHDIGEIKIDKDLDIKLIATDAWRNQ